jgi:hypothetical protein
LGESSPTYTDFEDVAGAPSVAEKVGAGTVAS